MLFYRFQNTKEIETNSYYVDLNMLHEDFREYKREYGESIDKILYKKYFNTLNMRSNISAIELFKLIKHSNWEEVSNLTEKYPLKYIFGMEKTIIDENYSFEELVSGREMPWYCEGYKYLVVYEGDLISDEGEISGCIFKPKKILNIFNTNY